MIKRGRGGSGGSGGDLYLSNERRESVWNDCSATSLRPRQHHCSSSRASRCEGKIRGYILVAESNCLWLMGSAIQLIILGVNFDDGTT